MVQSIRLIKYQALGNDYLFLDASEFPMPDSDQIRKICHRNFGIGSDGVLYGGVSDGCDFFVQIINPDGSIAEISGNGVRIFSRAMFDLGLVAAGEKFFVKTAKKNVECAVFCANRVAVDMGHPTFNDKNIPHFPGNSSVLTAGRKEYECFPVSIGNPHCVIFVDELSLDEVEISGKILEHNEMFHENTNVEFAKIMDRENIAIEIWERGVGRTLACGSGACAAFAVSRRLGLCSDEIKAHMAGGTLDLAFSDSGTIIQNGPVEKIASCVVDL
ncbi:MAG: diaminopimelate epimerase [Puniceicoccales bacterium]|jgi:diaminopimelate epimerase|nr:diaminopimelate epimerase [Puniceicoccales bacterium]